MNKSRLFLYTCELSNEKHVRSIKDCKRNIASNGEIQVYGFIHFNTLKTEKQASSLLKCKATLVEETETNLINDEEALQLLEPLIRSGRIPENDNHMDSFKETISETNLYNKYFPLITTISNNIIKTLRNSEFSKRPIHCSNIDDLSFFVNTKNGWIHETYPNSPNLIRMIHANMSLFHQFIGSQDSLPDNDKAEVTKYIAKELAKSVFIDLDSFTNLL